VGFFAKVCLIRYLGILVPVGRENALCADRLEGQPHSADAAEQIDKLGTVHVIAALVSEDNIDRTKRAGCPAHPLGSDEWVCEGEGSWSSS